LAINPSINGNAFNDAVSGAVMSGLNGQASNAVTQGAQYITILMGANDACKSNEASMTSVATFQSQFQTAMNTIHNGLPNARILVMSIPDLHRLWEVGSASATARTVWANFGICQAMLANPTSTAQVDVDRRLRVRQRVIDYNAALTTVCNATANCLTDGGALFNTQFLLNDLATFDYFHPSGAAQQRLAAASYSVYNW
jgi:lysophospholipase L1-like esterase